MTDGFVQVAPDATGKKIDTSEQTRADGTMVERQRVVIADPDDPTDLFSLDKLRMDRQLMEIQMIEAIEGSVAINGSRHAERPFALDRRGATTGRGATR